MASHWFIPTSVEAFHNFYAKPRTWFSDSEVVARLNWTAGTTGAILMNQAMSLCLQYESLYTQYREVQGTSEQHNVYLALKAKMDELGDKYNEMRDELNLNPYRIPEDNIRSELPGPTPRKNPEPAPIMTDSFPAIDNFKHQLAINTEGTFHDSADVNKEHKKPDGQDRVEVIGTYNDPKDPVPTQAEILATGVTYSATRNPLRINHGADKAGMRFSFVTRWVNKRNQAGMVSDVRSIILG